MTNELLTLASQQRAWSDVTRAVIYRWIVEPKRGNGRRALCPTRAQARYRRDSENWAAPRTGSASAVYVVRRLPFAILASGTETRWLE